MTNSSYTIRRATNKQDANNLKQFFNIIFKPQKVGDLAEVMYHHLPGMSGENWIIAEEDQNKEIASAFVRIPWVWEIDGIRLKVAEQGIVGTAAKYRKQGLLYKLNAELDRELVEQNYDLAVIQGIPGFYQNFGYRYTIPLENHLNMELRLVDDSRDDASIRMAGVDDIPLLMQQDCEYRENFFCSSYRSEEAWRYLFSYSRKTEYGSEFRIVECNNEKFYFRVSLEGFGEGLIISEISESVSINALKAILECVKKLAIEREKPYLRFNIHNNSNPGKILITLGAIKGESWGLQIKVPSVLRFLKTIAPLLEKRLVKSCMKNFSGVFRIDLFAESYDLFFSSGKIEEIKPGVGDCQHTFALSREIFPLLAVGHLTVQEIRAYRPDLFGHTAEAKQLMDILFPKKDSWIYCQY